MIYTVLFLGGLTTGAIAGVVIRHRMNPADPGWKKIMIVPLCYGIQGIAIVLFMLSNKLTQWIQD